MALPARIAASSSTPMTMFWVSPPRLSSCIPLRSSATRTTASTTPTIVPDAAEDVDAAEHDRRHDVEQRAVRGVGAGRAEEADVDEAGDPGHAGPTSRRRRPAPGHGDARVAGRLAVRADRVHVAAEPRRVQQEAERDAPPEEDEQRDRHLLAPDVAEADVREAERKGGDALAAVDQEREPAVGGQRPERDRERRQPDDRDEQAVHQARARVATSSPTSRREPDVRARSRTPGRARPPRRPGSRRPRCRSRPRSRRT